MIAVNRLAEKVHTLASYYGFGSVSYTNVLRDVISADSAEYWFKPVGWNNKKRSAEESHPQVGMHVVSAWTVGYYLLNLLTTYCSSSLVEPTTTMHHQTNNTRSSSLLPPGKPKLPPQNLPPVLTSDLTVGDLAEQWMLSSNNNDVTTKCSDYDDTGSTTTTPCIFSWISGITDFPEAALAPFIVKNSGWSFAEDHGKLGLVPEGGINSTVTLEFHNNATTHPIRSVMLMAMKSFGDKWANSSVRVQAFEIQRNDETVDDKGFVPPLVPIASIEVLGFHDSKTSVSYKESIPISMIGATSSTSSLRLTMELVGGSTAKIMGLTVCS